MQGAASANTAVKGADNAKISPAGKHITKQPASWTSGPDISFTVGTKPGLKFDTEALTVKAGDKVKLTFNNNDDMLHNMVFTTPGTANQVGEMALKLGLNGEKLSYVPAAPQVLFHTLLLQPEKSETIYFTAPDKPGEYEYVCTYPGHYTIMKGILKVVKG